VVNPVKNYDGDKNKRICEELQRAIDEINVPIFLEITLFALDVVI
jgi:hypothetical protein